MLTFLSSLWSLFIQDTHHWQSEISTVPASLLRKAFSLMWFDVVFVINLSFIIADKAHLGTEKQRNVTLMNY